MKGDGANNLHITITKTSKTASNSLTNGYGGLSQMFSFFGIFVDWLFARYWSSIPMWHIGYASTYENKYAIIEPTSIATQFKKQCALRSVGRHSMSRCVEFHKLNIIHCECYSFDYWVRFQMSLYISSLTNHGNSAHTQIFLSVWYIFVYHCM